MSKRELNNITEPVYELLKKETVARFEVDNVSELSDEQLDSLRCGDIVAKKTGNQKHNYIVTYKGEGAGEGICLTYCAAGYIETVSYDRTEDGWAYNSTDVFNGDSIKGFSGDLQVRSGAFSYIAKEDYPHESGLFRLIDSNKVVGTLCVQYVGSGIAFVGFYSNVYLKGQVLMSEDLYLTQNKLNTGIVLYEHVLNLTGETFAGYHLKYISPSSTKLYPADLTSNTKVINCKITGGSGTYCGNMYKATYIGSATVLYFMYYDTTDNIFKSVSLTVDSAMLQNSTVTIITN